MNREATLEAILREVRARIYVDEEFAARIDAALALPSDAKEKAKPTELLTRLECDDHILTFDPPLRLEAGRSYRMRIGFKGSATNVVRTRETYVRLGCNGDVIAAATKALEDAARDLGMRVEDLRRAFKVIE